MKKVFMDVSKSFDEDLKKIDNKTKNGIETLYFEVNEKNEKKLKIYKYGLYNYRNCMKKNSKDNLYKKFRKVA